MNTHWTQYLGYALTPILTVLILRGLGKLKSLKLTEPKAELTEEEQQHFKSMMSQASYIVIGSMLLAGWLIFLILRFIARTHLNLLKYEIMMPAPEVIYAIPALFLGIVIGGKIVEFYFIRKFGSTLYEKLSLVSYHQQGVNGKILNKIMYKWIPTFCLLFTIHSIFLNTYVQDNKLYIRRFFSLSTEVHDLKEIAQVIRSKSARAPNGNTVYRTYHYVLFKDGTKWDINNDEKTDYLFADALISKAGLQYTDKDFY